MPLRKKKHIIVKVGDAGDKASTPLYQVFEEVRDWTLSTYELVTHVQNDPVVLSTARARVQALRGRQWKT